MKNYNWFCSKCKKAVASGDVMGLGYGKGSGLRTPSHEKN
ncbi:unnamed protein product, partial [marine sediment metagenome]